MAELLEMKLPSVEEVVKNFRKCAEILEMRLGEIEVETANYEEIILNSQHLRLVVYIGEDKRKTVAGVRPIRRVLYEMTALQTVYGGYYEGDDVVERDLGEHVTLHHAVFAAFVYEKEIWYEEQIHVDALYQDWQFQQDNAEEIKNSISS